MESGPPDRGPRPNASAARRCGGSCHVQIARLKERLVAADRLLAERGARLAGIERAHTAEMGARDRTITDLRAKLARLQLPWWRRLVG